MKTTAILMVMGTLLLGQEESLLTAMNDEMIRSMKRLKMEDLEAPYYLEYTVRDTETASASASFGGLVSSNIRRGRSLSTDVRVGDYAFDNTNFSSGMMSMIRAMMGGRVPGGGRALPIDEDYDAIRHAIWLSTDRAYKEAVEALSEKKAVVKTSNITDLPEDFTRAEPFEHMGEVLTLSEDRAKWEGVVRRLSAIFREFPAIQTSEVSWRAGVTNQYFVSSEGSRHRWGRGTIRLTATASTQAEDGMRVSDTLSFRQPIGKGLPEEEEMAGKIRTFAEALTARAAAAEPEDYTGPVFFEGAAAGQLFDTLLVQGISNPRIPLFGESEGFMPPPQGAALARKVGRKVLSPEFTVFDDPSLSDWNGKALLGTYPVDDDGVEPRKVSLVEGGKLVTLLMSRVPTREVTGSNGHGRGEGQAVGAPGNVIIQAQEPKSDEDLKKAFLEMCREEDLEYGIIIRKGVSRARGGPMGMPFGRGRLGRRGGMRAARIAAFRVYVEDGREEPTRGLMIQDLNHDALRDIVGAGETRHVIHTGSPGAPASVVAPSVIVKEMDLRKPPPQMDRKPHTPPPGS
jgi:predicted Zn-dependent protease